MTLQQMKYAIALADTNSMNEAAKLLFISQPSLSSAIKELEEEIGFTIYHRSKKGVEVTSQGKEFLGYIRQVMEQYSLVEDQFLIKKKTKRKFSISSQHYSFVVKAFVDTIKQIGMDQYEFAIKETKTYEVIEDVKCFQSELGIIYLSNFNEKIINKLLKENELEYTELIQCSAYVYLWKGNPLAKKDMITMHELDDYPCLMFDQGDNNSFYFAEEILSTYHYKKIIKASDRATVLNLMVGLNGYTLCSGLICEELNGTEFRAIPLESTEIMRIGYIARKNSVLSEVGKKFIEELTRYTDKMKSIYRY